MGFEAARASEYAVRTHLAAWLDAGEELHAPGVLPYEVANVLARLIFDGALTSDDVTEIWHESADLGLVLHPFELTRDGPEVAAVTSGPHRRRPTAAVCRCVDQSEGAGRYVETCEGAAQPTLRQLGDGTGARSMPGRRCRS